MHRDTELSGCQQYNFPPIVCFFLWNLYLLDFFKVIRLIHSTFNIIFQYVEKMYPDILFEELKSSAT